jgi:meiotically up-regulated gene 157 (Mug157) protein
VTTIYHRAAGLNAALFFPTRDATTYVSTGDIDAMYLRDSSIQAMSILRHRKLVLGVIARQARLVNVDPYANSFYSNYMVRERKFELDSLCYPVILGAEYARVTRDNSVFDDRFFYELRTVLRTLEVEQDHPARSHYHHNEHRIAAGTGFIWSAFRPSDDAQTYNFNVPENMLAAVTLHIMARMFRDRYRDEEDAQRAERIAFGVEDAVEHHAIFRTTFGLIYAYEVDGRGHAVFMDDANTPSLLSIPLLGYRADPNVYAATRRFVLSPANPYFYQGRLGSGIGSSHTPPGYVWPLALMIQYRTASEARERHSVLRELVQSDPGDGALHESFDVNDPHKYTRDNFGWVNAVFTQTFR